MDTFDDTLEHAAELGAWGNPWHGRIAGTTLATDAGPTRTVAAVADPATYGVALPGLPDPPALSAAHIAAGMELKKTAILGGETRRWSPLTGGPTLGANKHIYRAADGSGFIITTTATPASTANMAPGDSRNVAIVITARRQTAAAGDVEILNTTRSIVNVAVPTHVVSTRAPRVVWTVPSPDGSSVGITIGAPIDAGTAVLTDARRAVSSIAAIIVGLSGGSASEMPVATVTAVSNATTDTVSATADFTPQISTPSGVSTFANATGSGLTGTYAFVPNPVASNNDTRRSYLALAAPGSASLMRALHFVTHSARNEANTTAGAATIDLERVQAGRPDDPDWIEGWRGQIETTTTNTPRLDDHQSGAVALPALQSVFTTDYIFEYKYFGGLLEVRTRIVNSATVTTGRDGLWYIGGPQTVGLRAEVEDGVAITPVITCVASAAHLANLSASPRTYQTSGALSLPWIAVEPHTGQFTTVPGESYA